MSHDQPDQTNSDEEAADRLLVAEVEGAVVGEDPESAPSLPAGELVAGAFRGLLLGRRPGAGPLGREILVLSWPVMLSAILVTAVGLIDVAMMGRLGPHALAAVGYATQFYFLAQSTLMAVGFACVALMARAIGAGRPDEARRSMIGSALVGLATAGALCVVMLAAPRTVLGWLNAEPAVIDLTLPYLRLLFASSLLLALSLTGENALRANRDTVTPLWIAAIVTAVKIGANVILIFGYWGFPRLELVGAGWATVLSQVVAVSLFTVVLVREPAGSPLAPRLADLGPALRSIPRVVRIVVPGVSERILLNLALLAYFAILGRYGTLTIAAYTIGVRILAFSWIPGIAYGAAASTLVGQSLGREQPDEAERIGWQATRIALVTAAALGVVCIFSREMLAGLFTDDPEIIATLGPFMVFLAVAQPLLQVHFTLAGAHRGAGDTWTPLVASAVGNWIFRVPLACLFGLYFEWSLLWFWSALVVDHLVRVIWLAIAFRRGDWKDTLATRPQPKPSVVG